MLSRLRPRLLLLAAVLLVPLGLPAPGHAAAAGAPEVGQCHQLGPGQLDAQSDTTRAVRCGRRHNTLTIAVVTSATSLSGSSAEETFAIGDRLCTTAALRALGRSAVRRATSAYVGVFFQPTAEEIAQGARWFRCDIALRKGRTIASLPAGLRRPILPRRASDATRRCLTRTGLGTTCAHRHAYRPIRAVVLPHSAYPTRDEFTATAARSCPKHSAWATWSGEPQWNAGDRVLVCYRRTTT